MIVKKTQRRLYIMLIGIVAITILTLLDLFAFSILPLGVFVITLLFIVYLFYEYNLVTNNPFYTVFKDNAKMIYTIIDYFSVLVYVVIIVQLLFNFVFFPATVRMSSMNPLLFEDDRLIVFNGNNNLRRFDIIVFEVDTDTQTRINESENGSLWVKRVIGVPGERIDFVDGQLYVNGTKVYEVFLYDEDGKFHKNTYEGYYSLTPDFQMEDILSINNFEGNIIPEDYYLLLGDNRAYSTDANEIGLIHKSQIIGEAKYINRGIFSFEKIGG